MSLTRTVLAPPHVAPGVTPHPPGDTTRDGVRRTRRAGPVAAAAPRWARPGLAALLLGTAVLYLWGLGASGYANEFYASAVQAGTQSWKAMFFGSLDAGNAITVDKPPFFLWPMEISARLFGVNGWSMLVPQALEGVAAVALLAAAVRRVAGHAAGVLAGAALAVTPVAVLMFRFDNPDAMLTLLLTAAAYATVRAVTAPGTRGWGLGSRWLALAGTFVGLAFITKMGQAFLVLPGFALAYLWAAPVGLGRRIRDLLGAGVAMVGAAGWWVAAVELWPASDRPYIGGSTTNSVLELAFGYNGLGRLFGGTGNGGGGGASFAGSPGITRLFDSSSGMATEISWLLPTSLLALVAGVWLTRRAPRTDPRRAALIALGGWLLVTGLVFSYMQGTIHPYYAVALAPAIAGIVAVTGSLLWEQRSTLTARGIAAVLVEVTVLWNAHLLGLTPTFVPWLPAVLVVGGTLAAAVLVVAGRWRRLLAVALLAGMMTGAAGSAAYAVSTAAQPHSGSTPSSGPAAAAGLGGGAGGRGFAGQPSGTTGTTGTTGAGAGAGTTSVGSSLAALLQATGSRWAAATTGSMSAAPIQLATGKAVMAIGGFNGSDDAPTLAQFKAWVAAGEVRYFIAGSRDGQGPGGGSDGASSQITSWVEQTFSYTMVDGYTVYDLASTAATS
jgi:4-amino-4-deoxy-L-arabinose transferase-like glycosyltransferase